MNIPSWISALFRRRGSSADEQPAGAALNDPAVAELNRRYQSLRRSAVQLRPATEPRFSRLGGLPRMPTSLDWPEWKGKPLAFLAQLDLSEVHTALASCLPEAGYLYFFYDQEQSVWGFDPKDRGAWRVFYCTGDADGFAERAAPAALTREYVYRPKPVTPTRIEVLPSLERLPEGDTLSEDESSAYDLLRAAAFGKAASHQMLGYPTPVQADEMELECQLASNGVYVGDPAGYQDPRVQKLEAGKSEWILLLQLDSDDETGWMWGDVGTLYFWIRESDARRGDFSNVWLILQCS